MFSGFQASGKSNMQVKLSIEHWWNDTDKRKPKYPAKSLSHCHFLRLKLMCIYLESNSAHSSEKQVPDRLLYVFVVFKDIVRTAQ